LSVTVLEPGSSLLVRRLATRVDITARAQSVSSTILTAVFPEREQDDTFVATLRRCSMENVTGVVNVLAGRVALREVDAPCAREFAGLMARLSMPLGELERSYRVGMERLWQEWFDLCRTSSADGKGELPDLLSGSTSLLFGYVDRVLAQVVEQYRVVTEEMAATSEDRRRELVLKLLDDMPAEAGESADALLGYRMRATHVGLLFSSDNHRDVAKALSSMREQSKAPVSLLVQPDAGTWFGWLGYHDGVDANRLELLRQAATTAGEQVVIGEPGHGPAGFRRSHHSARRTAELRPTLRNAPSCLCRVSCGWRHSCWKTRSPRGDSSPMSWAALPPTPNAPNASATRC